MYYPGKFKLETVSIDQVQKELQALHAHKGTGLDNESSRFLKEGADFLAQPIAHIINKSIKTGNVPDVPKVAKVTHYTKRIVI